MSLALPASTHRWSRWQVHLSMLGLAWLVLLALFSADVGDMIAIWWRSATFNHCFLIPPIIAWLVAQRLPELERFEPVGWVPGLGIVAIGGACWLIGEAGGIAFARQLGLVIQLQGAVLVCLGPAIARGLAFPIFYALFMVPFGEEAVPAMQVVTAEIAMVLLHLAGIPAHLEGIFITTSFGYFEVAEACAGVRFLIAMLAFGALVANVCFRSWRRRILFMLAVISISILANGIRAWGTMVVASLTSIEFAVGFDHVIYGGIFFAFVIAMILAAGWPFFDRAVDDCWIRLRPDERRVGPSPILIAGMTIMVAAASPAWSAFIEGAGTRPVDPGYSLPAVEGWTAETGGEDWRPNFAGADLVRAGRYRDTQGHRVDLVIAVYARQDEGRELVGYGQGAAGADNGWAWIDNQPSPPDGRAERIASHGVVREVVSFYRVGNATSGSAMGVKLETLKARLFGGPQRAVAVLVSSAAPAAGISPRPAIDAFLADLGPVDRLADRAAGLER